MGNDLSRSFLPENTSAESRQSRTVVPTVHSLDVADQTQEQLRTIVLHSPPVAASRDVPLTLSLSPVGKGLDVEHRSTGERGLS